MVHFGIANVIGRSSPATTWEDSHGPSQHCVLIVRGHDKNSEYPDSVCGFLNVGVEHATACDDLRSVLPVLRPIAVIADLEAEVQDGFHVMKLAARYDRSLPVLLLTRDDPALLGAVDAVGEMCGLTHVSTATPTSGIGELVDFVCHASRDAGRSRLMRI